MSKEIKDVVKEKYSQIVELDKSCGCGCGNDFGFSDGSENFSKDYSKLEGYEKDADYALGCGIPTAFVSVKEGDTVVDLGSGAGNDVFVARRMVGESGKVIGIDMTEAMIEKANKNNKKLGYENVEFRLGDIENMPVKDNTADVVISNCVMNLVPDKEKGFAEVYRILNHSGKFSISDIVISGDLPEKLKQSAEMYVGCVAGAIDIQEYINTITGVGFQNVKIVEKKKYVLPDELVKQFLSEDDFKLYKASNAEILSITVYGERND
jgi:ubiquinone/menaquinone biosynthesis C-methylase UbiE